MADARSQLERYARHYLIDWWDQDRLLKANVIVAGAGALGNEALKLLALMGVGRVHIVDFDTIEISNLTRTVLFNEKDVGRNKAEVAAERTRQLNPDTEVTYTNGNLEYDLGWGEYKEADVVLGCLDSIDARLSLNRICQMVGVPWVNGGIGVTEGEVSYFDPDQGACFECTMTESMWEQRNQRYSCGWLRSLVREQKVPTTATIASIVAALMVNQAFLVLHDDKKSGLGPGQRLFVCLKPYSLNVASVPKNPECYAHDHMGQMAPLERAPHEITADEILQLVGSPESSYLEIMFDLAVKLTCPNCRAEEYLLLPTKSLDLTVLPCKRCGSERKLFSTGFIEGGSELARRKLSDLSIPKKHIVAAHSSGDRKYFLLK
ncbi:MAG: ThiF family adenylyltransferase [Candidatus Bathyarchaeia archaeon]|jgi:adenylyltransferase/sulfurtransferase